MTSQVIFILVITLEIIVYIPIFILNYMEALMRVCSFLYLLVVITKFHYLSFKLNEVSWLK